MVNQQDDAHKPLVWMRGRRKTVEEVLKFKTGEKKWTGTLDVYAMTYSLMKNRDKYDDHYVVYHDISFDPSPAYHISAGQRKEYYALRYAVLTYPSGRFCDNRDAIYATHFSPINEVGRASVTIGNMLGDMRLGTLAGAPMVDIGINPNLSFQETREVKDMTIIGTKNTASDYVMQNDEYRDGKRVIGTYGVGNGVLWEMTFPDAPTHVGDSLASAFDFHIGDPPESARSSIQLSTCAIWKGNSRELTQGRHGSMSFTTKIVARMASKTMTTDTLGFGARTRTYFDDEVYSYDWVVNLPPPPTTELVYNIG